MTNEDVLLDLDLSESGRRRRHTFVRQMREAGERSRRDYVLRQLEHEMRQAERVAEDVRELESEIRKFRPM